MNRPAPTRILAAALLGSALALSACASTRAGPVEVTRFLDPASRAQLGQGSIFVTGLGGEDSLELAPYKAAVARELAQAGYTETARTGAGQIAEVRVTRYELGRNGQRSPVNVGVGGSTGTYGWGLGLGIGINLGGGGNAEVGTEMAVVIREASSGRVLWEGRADFTASENSPLAERAASAQTVAAALFSDFPGNNGETIEVEVP